MTETKYLLSSNANAEHLAKSIEQTKDCLKNEETEIPPKLIANLIDWMRKKEISEEDIVDCMLYICNGK